MSRRELEVGSFVQITGFEVGQMAPEASYRIEQLLKLDDGATLYKIRCEAEPFDRVVDAPRLTRISSPITFLKDRLMRLLAIAAVVVSLSAALAADTPAVEFDGQRYTLGYEDQAALPDGQPGNGIAEFALPGETVDDWSKLFAFYAYPEMGSDTVAAAEAVGKAVKAANKDANYAVVTNDKTGETIIDFLTWVPESDVMEFNVFKYARAADGRGLVAMQYARHIKLGDIDVEGMRELRATSVANMASADISQAQSYFAGKRARSASNEGANDRSAAARAGRTR